ncbi:MAG: hypothetical protein QG608_1801 [Actinomycetota bacterium]|nr:hypothetical protein [Actinomycetota bacterium]
MNAHRRLFTAEVCRRPGRAIAILVTCLITAAATGAGALLIDVLIRGNPARASTLEGVDAVVVAASPTGGYLRAVPRGTLDAVRGADDRIRAAEYRDRWLSLLGENGTATPGSDGRPTRVWNWSAAQLLGHRITAGEPPTGTGLVIDERLARRAGLHVGDLVHTIGACGAVERRVTGLVRAPTSRTDVLLADDTEFTRLPGSPLAQAVLVKADPGGPKARSRAVTAVFDALKQRLPGTSYRVLDPADYHPGLPDPLAEEIDDALSLLTLLLFVLLTSAAVVLGTTVSLWVWQRLHDLTILRVLGNTPWRIRWLLVRELIMLAAPASAVGALLCGLPLADAARSTLVDSRVLPGNVPSAGLTGGTLAVCALTVLFTVLLTLLAATNAVVASGRVDPASVLRSQAPVARLGKRRGRLIAGLVLAVLGILPLAMNVTAGPMILGAASTGAALMLVPAAAILSPWLVPPLARCVGSFVAVVDRTVGPLAAANVRTASVRTAALAAPALLAMGLTTVMLGAPRTIDREITHQTGQRLLADYVVTASDGAALPVTGAFPARFPAGTGTAPTDGTTTGLVSLSVLPPAQTGTGPRRWLTAVSVDPASIERVLDLDAGKAGLAGLTQDTFAVGRSTADLYGWTVGDTMELTFPDGTRRSLRMVTIYARDLGFAEIVLDRSAVNHVPDPQANTLLLPGGPPQEPPPWTTVTTRAQYLADLRPRSAADTSAMMFLSFVLAGYALLSLANTAALSQTEHSSERRTLRFLGGTRSQVLRLVTWEICIAVTTGTAIGLTVAYLGLAPLGFITAGGPLPDLEPGWALGLPVMCLAAGVLPAVFSYNTQRKLTRQ